MSDIGAGAGSGAREDKAGRMPPPVLLAVLGAALVIAVTLVALLLSGGGAADDDGQPASSGRAGASESTPAQAAEEDRFMLEVAFEGEGDGEVSIAPVGVTCTTSCTREFAAGTSVTLTADAERGSTFEGWVEDFCAGETRCAVVLDQDRSVTALFESSETDDPLEPPASVRDCGDGRDNDDDGLVDSAQDPGCDEGYEGADGGAQPPTPTTTTTPTVPGTPPPPPPPPPPPSAATNECADGRDNDSDGLIDTAQDPGCEGSRTEAD